MKMTNVVAVRDVASATPPHPEVSPPNQRKVIEALLRRYPDVSDTESEEILRFLSNGPHLDVGLIGGNDELAPKVAAFKHDHRKHFQLKLWEIAAFVTATLGPVAVLGYIYL